MNILTFAVLMSGFIYLNFSKLGIKQHSNYKLALPDPETSIYDVFTALSENLNKYDLFKPKINADYDLERFMYQIKKGMKKEDINIILNNYIHKRDTISNKIEGTYK